MAEKDVDENIRVYKKSGCRLEDSRSAPLTRPEMFDSSGLSNPLDGILEHCPELRLAILESNADWPRFRLLAFTLN
jgi:hypothetical protein